MHQKLCFIGGGNMASAIISGLYQDGFNTQNIIVFDRNKCKLEYLQHQFNIKVSDNIESSIQSSNTVILAIKPQQLKELAIKIKNTINKTKPLIITVIAGVMTQTYSQWFSDVAIARVMPNTPSSVGAGASGLFFCKNVSSQQRELVEYIMRTMGIAITLDDENLIDVVAAVSGSGPAYFLAFMEAMIRTATKLNLSKKQAILLVKQTVLGTAKMSLSTKTPISILRENITSKGGTTAEALRIFDKNDLDKTINDAMLANIHRAKELANSFTPVLEKDN